MTTEQKIIKRPSPNSVDTWLSHSRPRFELGRGIVAERGVTALPIIEHLNVLEDVLCRVVPSARSADGTRARA